MALLHLSCQNFHSQKKTPRSCLYVNWGFFLEAFFLKVDWRIAFGMDTGSPGLVVNMLVFVQTLATNPYHSTNGKLVAWVGPGPQVTIPFTRESQECKPPGPKPPINHYLNHGCSKKQMVEMAKIAKSTRRQLKFLVVGCVNPNYEPKL